ncbi:MAG TPA: hypothetical protein PLF84_09765 [Bryobacteraceae bacterium]|nr:hypothetical protein [Bryobacteraceae bacterium]
MTSPLAHRAQELLDAMRDSLASGGSIETWVAFETAEGGLTLLEDCHDAPESLRWSRGAQRIWRVRRVGNRLIAEGFAGDVCCRLEAPAPRSEVTRLLERAIPYEVRPG